MTEGEKGKIKAEWRFNTSCPHFPDRLAKVFPQDSVGWTDRCGERGGVMFLVEGSAGGGIGLQWRA